MAFEIWLTIIPLVILFIYGIENFSKEIQKSAGTHFNSIIRKATKSPIRATFFGAIVTALTQSSTATTLITVGLVNAGAMTFAQSIGIIFGANIGTTVTSQLVALKLTSFAPILIIIGFIISFLKTKYKVFGKPIFYFGLVLFSLNLISLEVSPLRNDPQIISLLAQTSIIPIGIIAGFIVTNIFQSSSVTTGLIVVFAQSGLIGLPQAMPLIFGANLGTTTTTVLASFRMDSFAKKAAVSHFLFNIAGVLLFLPIIYPFISLIEIIGGDTAIKVANAHLLFNITVTIIMLIFINQFRFIVEKIVKSNEKEITLRTKNLEGAEKKVPKETFSLINDELKNSFNSVIKLFTENKSILISTKFNSIKITKLGALIDFIHKEISYVLTETTKKELTKNESKKVVIYARISKLTQQLGNIGKEIGNIIIESKETGNNFSEQSIIDIDECLTKIIENTILIKKNYPSFNKKASLLMKKDEDFIRKKITQSYDEYFKRIDNGEITSGNCYAEVLGLIQDAESKIREIRKIMTDY